MSNILGLGISHYPPFRGTDDWMASILRRNLQRPDVPDSWKDPRTWPQPMQEEWGTDEGRSAASKHRAQFVKHMRIIRRALDEFNPDFIVIWGDDQYENFKEDIIPPFCIYAYEDMEIYPYRPRRDRLTPGGPLSDGDVLAESFVSSDAAPAVSATVSANAWGESADTKFLIRGKREAAKYLARGLLGEKIDMPYAYQPLHYEGLSHAFLNSVMYLDYDRKGFEYPLIPMAVNCYGRHVLVNHGGGYPVGKITVPEGDLDPPSPSPERCMEVGAAVARVLKRSPWKVALVASSSWSHAFLTPKHYFMYPDSEADGKMYESLVRGDYDYWRSVTESQVVDCGQQEVLNWWTLMGAMEELGHGSPDYHGYVESHVMNSNKVFAYWNP